MSDEERLEEVSESSPAEDTAAPVGEPDVVQKDIEVNRKSIKDTLRAAFDESKREPSKARQEAAKARPRTEDGKFVPKEEAKEKSVPVAVEPTEPVKAEAPATGSQSTTEKPVVPVAAVSEPAHKAPDSWSQEAKTAWASLPAVIHQAIAKREREVSDGFLDYSNRTKDIERAFGPQRDLQLQQLGKTRGEAINQLFYWHDALANPATRVQAFTNLARSHGIDLSTLVPSTGQAQQPTDPSQINIDHLLQTRLQEFAQPVLQQVGSLQQQLEQERLAKAQSELSVFSKDKPHFERVRGAMAQMISSGYAQDLNDAYQKATWADPDIRTEILAQEQAKRDTEAKAAQEAAQAKAVQAEEERKRKEKELADKARRANIGVRSSTGAGAPNIAKSGKSIREGIVGAIRDLRA